MFKKITLFVFLFLVIGIGCFALIERDNLNNNLSNQIEQMEKTYSGKLDSMTAYQNTLVVRINTLEDSLAQLRQSYDELNQTYQNAVEQYTLDLEELNTQLTDVRNTLSELQASSDVDKAKIEELQNKVSELQQSISEKNVTIEQLNATIEAQQTTIDELNATIDELIAELNSDLSSQLDFYKNLIEGEVTEITASDLQGVTKIRDYAFYNSPITSITFPSSLVEIGSYAFYGCRNLSGRLIIPEGVTSIGYLSFGMCFPSLYLPTTIKSLDTINSAYDYYDIYYSGSLKDWFSITFNPNGVTGTSAHHTLFINGVSLTEITAKDLEGLTSIPAGSLTGTSSLRKITLSDTITELPDYTFYKCIDLSSLTIPASVTNIGCNVFYQCPLTEMTILAETPPTLGGNAISSETTTIYIPAGTLSAYQTATNWSNYASYFVEFPAYPTEDTDTTEVA